MGMVKKISIGIVSLLILVAVTIGVISATVDPNDYKSEITDLVKKQTGRDLSFDNIELAFFPSIGVNLENVRLSNAPGFESNDFLKMSQAQVSVAIWPLLSKQLEIDTLTLHDLDVRLARNAQGVTNWDDLIKPSENAQAVDTQSEEKTNPMDQLAALNFGGLDIRNGQVHWDDQQTQQKIDLTDFNFVTGAITFGEFFNLDLNANTQVSQPEISSQLTLSLEVKLDKNGAFEIKNLKQTNQLQGKTIPVAELLTELEIPVLNINLDQQQINLPNITLTYSVKGGADLPAKQLDGSININKLSANLADQVFATESINLVYNLESDGSIPIDTAKGSLTLDQPSFAMAEQALTSGLLTLKTDLTGETLPNGKASIQINTQPALNLNKETASLSNLIVNALNLQANGEVQVTQLMSNPNIQNTLDIKAFNLRELLTQLGMQIPAVDEMSDQTTLTKVAAKLKVKFNSETQAVNAQSIQVILDDSTLSGNASVANFDKPNIAYNLNLDKINVSRYLPPPTEAPAEPIKTAEETDVEIPLPTELLRGLTINGTLKAGSVQYDKLNPTNIVVTVKAKDGLFNVNPIKTDIFKTNVSATAKLDVRKEQPDYAVTFDTKNLPIGEVLIAFIGEDHISGTGAVNADITTSGNRLSLIKQGLNGTLSADLQDGAVKGFNLAQSIRQAKEKLGGKKSATADEPLKTDFSSLVGQFVIKDGVVDTKKLQAQAPFMRVDGSGTVDLVKEKLNYLVKTKIVATDKGQGGEDLKELNGLTIPVKLKGALTSPDVSLDLGSLMEQKAKDEVKKKIDDKKKEVTKGLEEKLKGGLLKGLPF
ncbi:MAG: AsmA family protein [Thiotrichales bacterium]|nr:AsmA family protein [Thiotrichales bacterium]